MARVQFATEALRNPRLVVSATKGTSLHCISTCSALLRCVLRGLGGRGNSLCGEQPLCATWFPVASQLRMHPCFPTRNRLVRGPTDEVGTARTRTAGLFTSFSVTSCNIAAEKPSDFELASAT